MSEDARYPVGRFRATASPTAVQRREWMEQMAEAPSQMRAAVAGLTDAQLDTPYREGGWTVRQVVHHVPDSHMNGLVRTCLALTEVEPVIKPYDEDAWSRLPYAAHAVEESLQLLELVQARWLSVWRGMDDGAFARAYVHPENGVTTLAGQLDLYAWHGRHHVAHITSLRARRGW